jgi:transcriptional regulator with GAF, ATPase, and Fis domain
MIDENKFFRQATLRICGSLDIEEAMRRCLRYLEEVIPVDRISLLIYERDLGAMRTLLLATHHEEKELNILTSLPPELRDKIDREVVPGALVIDRPGLKPVEVRIVNRPEDDPVIEQFSQYVDFRDASVLLMSLKDERTYLGNLMFGVKGRGRYTEEDARLLSFLHEPFVIALSNALKHQEVLKLKDMLADDNRYLNRELFRLSGDAIIGAESGLRGVVDMACRVAHLDSPVLLRGETGVGKDVIAHAIHYSSPRNDGPFIKVNCGAIPETLIDSELFGHERGAFTGAIAQNRGCFERADRGTIFLDEIGELPLPAQVRLLRVIQYKEIQRVGGTAPVSVNIRILAATHCNLEEMVKTGRFREDLWFRLNVFPIVIPPLRERKGDIPTLVDHFVQRKSRDLRLSAPQGLAPGAIDRLMSYGWPGNVRELENVIERALILSGGGPLAFNQLLTREENRENVTPSSEVNQPWPLDEAMSAHIRRALKQTNGRVQGPGGTAALLGVKPSTLRSRMNKLGISYKKPGRNSMEKLLGNTLSNGNRE